MNEQDRKKRRFGRLVRWLLILAALVLALALALLGVGAWVNSTRVPPELAALPAGTIERVRAIENNGTTEPAGPDERTELTSATTAATPATTATATPALDVVKDRHRLNLGFDEYLKTELARNPSLTGTALYLQLTERFTHDNLTNQANTLFDKPLTGTLATEQAEWLAARGELIDLIMRFAESDGFEMPRLSEWLDAARHPANPDQAHPGFLASMPVPNYLSFQTMGRILAWAGLRQAANGDLAGAERAWLGIYRLGAKLTRGPGVLSPLIMMGLARQGNQAWRFWLDREPPPPEMARRWLAEFNPLHDRLFPRGLAADILEAEYISSRFMLVAVLEISPWNSQVYGYDVGSDGYNVRNPLFWDDLIAPHNRKYVRDVWIGHESFAVPRLGSILNTGLTALRRKRQAPGLLPGFDAWWREELARQRLDYPVFRARPFPEIDPRNFLLAIQAPNYDELHHRATVAEAGFNLLRLALQTRAAGKPMATAAATTESAESAPAMSTRASLAYDNPWRDPLTERPFHVATLSARDAVTTATLIYSLGPDLTDQHGQVAYDPSNGTVSAGDLMIRVPGTIK